MASKPLHTPRHTLHAFLGPTPNSSSCQANASQCPQRKRSGRASWLWSPPSRNQGAVPCSAAAMRLLGTAPWGPRLSSRCSSKPDWVHSALCAGAGFLRELMRGSSPVSAAVEAPSPQAANMGLQLQLRCCCPSGQARPHERGKPSLILSLPTHHFHATGAA